MGWFSKSSTPAPAPAPAVSNIDNDPPPSYDEVKEMFLPFKVDDTDPIIKEHLESLTTKYNDKVVDWRSLFYKCMRDVGIEESYPVAGENGSGIGYYILKFKEEIASTYYIRDNKTIYSILNNTTQEGFVITFAKIMSKIKEAKGGSKKKSRKRGTRNRRRGNRRTRARRSSSRR